MRRLGRPRLYRRILSTPNSTYFKPRGIPMSSLNEVVLAIDEFEAVNLKIYKD